MFGWWESVTEWIVRDMLKISAENHWGSALQFFLFDTVKIFILLSVIIYGITYIRSYFPPERTRAILSKRKGGTFIGHILAALLGIVTPFCSCSAVPLFIGFVEAGIPLGVTFSYLVAAPMVNEVALGMLWVLFGWKIALIYIASGEVIAIVSGIVIGRLHMEKHVEAYVYEMQMGAQIQMEKPTQKQRLSDAWAFTLELVKKIWIYVVIGIGIGGIMHGWIPTNALGHMAGKDNPFAVIIAVLIGIPLYSNAAGVIPLVSELTRAGVALGTSLAFMMAVTGLSLPEMILLRRVLKPKLLAVFFSIVGVGIIFTGYLFNWIM
ncbi:MAG TPA: permease [Candidatus Cloacimonadota bacterium]|nr:permease [Candidatus Cloacimonadota bacterium]HPT70675.1 permease [Candidatus Cloacimonadota bacterium]